MESISTKKRQRRSNKKTETKTRIDFLTSKFSKELVLNVFSFLSLQDLIQCTAVSAEWSSMANDEMLWKPLFFRRFRDPFLLEHHKFINPHKNRRVSVTRYGGSWKMKYRIHHNWVLGKCSINDIGNVFGSSSQPHHLQFLNDIIFTAQRGDSIIKIWRYLEDSSVFISELPIVEEGKVDVTFLRLVQGKGNHLVAGYSNGGFTVWKVEGSSSYDVSIEEIASYIPNTRESGNVTSIGLDYPMLIVCTDKMKLSIFHIEDSYSLQLVHRLQSPIDWSHIDIDIHRYFPKRQSQCDRFNEELWRVILCFGISGEAVASSIGVQELILSNNSIKSSRHGFALDCEPVFSPVHSASTSEQISAMAYSPPYLITAHANNTMKQYTINIDKDSIGITFDRILYGHTFQVNALAIDASRRKLISGDRSGIRIWNLGGNCESQVVLKNHLLQSEMKELPLFSFERIGFDEDKIVAIVNFSDQSFMRVWSFNNSIK